MFAQLPPAEQNRYRARMGKWYQSRGYYEDAIHWLSLSDDYEALLAAVEENRGYALNIQHQEEVLRWLEQCPKEILARHSYALLIFMRRLYTFRRIPEMLQLKEFFLQSVSENPSLSEEERSRIIDLMEEWQIEAFLEGSEDVYCQRRDYRQKVMNIVRASFNKEGLGLSKFIEDRNFVFDKFVFVSDNPANSDAFIRSITSFIDVIDRGKGMYECVPKGFSKASAMQLLSEHLNISMDNTWAFGDSSNDLPMFEAAAHGIAMGDHSSVLEPFSEMITDTVDNDGIAKALSHFGLI